MSTWDVGVDVNAALGFGLDLDATSPGDVFFFDPEPAGLEKFEIPDVLDEENFASLILMRQKFRQVHGSLYQTLNSSFKIQALEK